MRLKSISVKALFGVFNHEIPLENPDRLTIILGPNGFGKTVMLRMISAFAEGRTKIFEQTPFEEFCLNFRDGTGRVIRRVVDLKGPKEKPRARLEFLARDAKGGLTSSRQPRLPENLPEDVLAEVDSFVPAPYSLRGRFWVDDEGERYTLAEILEKFPLGSEALPRKYRPTFFSDKEGELHAFFIETNRLGGELVHPRPHSYAEARTMRELMLHERPTRPSMRVRQYSKDLLQQIRSVLADYARHSQESDRTFPERLVRFSKEKRSALEPPEILTKMQELERKRQRLIGLGLLDTESGLRGLTEEDVEREREALTIYVQDVQEKLEVFDDMSRRIGILMDIINNRFRYKTLRVDRGEGFQILSNKKQSVQLEDLSSGEQHELVVLYELLFRAPRAELILVDEPEISLHVAWQSRFLSDLIEILKLTGSYAIVATHSPVIIGERWDLAVELQGP